MITIKQMTLDDLDKVYQLELDSYKSPWTREMFLSELKDNKYAYMFVIAYDAMVIGYYGFWAVDDNAMITKVTVARPLRGKGIGKIAMNDAFERLIKLGCSSASLEVRVSNNSAIHLYEQIGFIKVGTRKKYYSDGEDAYAMVIRFDKGEAKDEETYIRNRD